MKIRTFPATLSAAALTVTTALAGKTAVRLVASNPIQPTTTYELRFDEAMVALDQVGKREDRALFFADAIRPGEYAIRYLARVRAAGTATAPAAKIEETYHPERFGITETLQMTSLPLK